MPDVYGMAIRPLRIHAGNMKNFCMINRRSLVKVDVVFSLMPIRVFKFDCANQIKSAHTSSFSDRTGSIDFLKIFFSIHYQAHPQMSFAMAVIL
ncbi:hypothetical protein CIW65_06885 [Enterobacter cloacae]|nr:hypothetical protein AWS33_11040 [Enterobacter cloacae subsp. cloacae]PAN87810.1 hypothetical protein CIW65_06885 [Enterobacter cloacae]